MSSSVKGLDQRLQDILLRPEFLEMRGVAKEVPIFIQTYNPADDDELRRVVQGTEQGSGHGSSPWGLSAQKTPRSRPKTLHGSFRIARIVERTLENVPKDPRVDHFAQKFFCGDSRSGTRAFESQLESALWGTMDQRLEVLCRAT